MYCIIIIPCLKINRKKMLSCYLVLKFTRFNFSVADARGLKGIEAKWAPGVVVKFLSQCKQWITSQTLDPSATRMMSSLFHCLMNFKANNLLPFFPLIAVLLKLVLTDNMEGMTEAIRVFGNITRHRPVRDFLSQKKG